jgi:hypothetical protein
MRLEQFMPFASMVISALAAIAYLYAGDYRRAVYWVAASVLTASVTF